MQVHRPEQNAKNKIKTKPKQTIKRYPCKYTRVVVRIKNLCAGGNYWNPLTTPKKRWNGMWHGSWPRTIVTHSYVIQRHERTQLSTADLIIIVASISPVSHGTSPPTRTVWTMFTDLWTAHPLSVKSRAVQTSQHKGKLSKWRTYYPSCLPTRWEIILKLPRPHYDSSTSRSPPAQLQPICTGKDTNQKQSWITNQTNWPHSVAGLGSTLTAITAGKGPREKSTTTHCHQLHTPRSHEKLLRVMNPPEVC